MSATPPPRSPSPSVEPDQVHSSPPPSAQPEVKTPERKHDPARPVPNITPLSHGASVRQRQEGDSDRIDGYTRNDYEDYIREDLKSRVFVDFEVFMEYVLHVPHDWETLWKPAIEAIETDSDFKRYHGVYCGLCNTPGSVEAVFYEPLVKTANAALSVLSRDQFHKIIRSGVPQYYRVNDPNKLHGGVLNRAGLSPDLVVLHEECNPPKKKSLHWANPLHVLEVKPFDSAICDGTNLPRLVVDGRDPIEDHAGPPTPSRYRVKTAPSISSTAARKSHSSSNAKKRPADGPPPADSQPPSKKSNTRGSTPHQKADDSGSIQNKGGDEGRSTSKSETQRKTDPAAQVCRYLLEMFSVPLLRSHATAGLVDRDRLQLYHANRSVILVSSAINFSEGAGLKKYIANIIAFYCLSFDQHGILDTLVPNNTKIVRNPDISDIDRTLVQKGNKLVFKIGETQFTGDLADIISHDPATVGRSTAVLGAMSDKWPRRKLAIKVSWPSSSRVSETELLEKVNSEARKTEREWAAKHLPEVLASEDVTSDKNPTLDSVARLFEKAEIVGGDYQYERRTRRVIIQERLYTLKSLSKVKDIGQVFLDVACIHRWLYDKPGVLHRDLSLNNIMYRIVEEMNAEGGIEYNIYGVLTDYDLSSWTASLKTDYTKTSQQRTGTPPYMAHELLRGTSDIHLYRHDVESLFYIMLTMCGRHTIGRTNGIGEGAKWRVMMREGRLPYEDWYNEPSFSKLGSLKVAFFSGVVVLKLSPTFEDFRTWLKELRYCFSDGFDAKSAYEKRKERAGSSAGQFAPFDDETLGGHVDYSSFIKPAYHLGGELQGLIVRYDPTSSPISTGAD